MRQVLFPSAPASIARSAILARVENAAPRLILLEAPAGYGKSSTAVQLAESFGPSLYCDLASAESAAEVARLLVSAIEGDVSRPVSADHETAWTLQAIRALSDGKPADRTLVIDNADVIADLDGAPTLLGRIVAAASRSIARLILCSRRPLPLRTAYIASSGETLVLRGADLRFGEIETRTALASAPDTLIERALAWSDGWPVLVTLMQRALAQGRLAELLDDAEGDGSLATDFVLDEIVAELTTEGFDVALAACCMPNPTIEDLTSAFGEAIVARTLHEIRPLVCEREGQIVAHPLLRSVMLERFGARARGLLVWAADERRSVGDAIRAARMLVAAGDVDSAARALEAPRAPFSPPRLELRNFVESFDLHVYRAHPSLWCDTFPLRCASVSPETFVEEGLDLWRHGGRTAAGDVRANLAVALTRAFVAAGKLEGAERFLDELSDTVLEGESSAAQALVVCRTMVRLHRGLLGNVARFGEVYAPLRESAAWDAIYHCDVVARTHRYFGDWIQEAEASSKAVQRALESRWPAAIALCLTDAAFGAWLRGADDLFKRYVTMLESCVGSAASGVVNHFLECARGNGAAALIGVERLDTRTQGWIVAAATALDPHEQRTFVRNAVECADASGQAYYRVLARAVGSLVDGTGCEYLTDARSIGAQVDGIHLLAALDSLDGARQDEKFSALPSRFQPVKRGGVIVRVISDVIEAQGKAVACADIERQLLTVLALHSRPFDREELVAKIWPGETDMTDALFSLKAYISQIRRKFGPHVVLTTARGFQIGPDVSTDLDEIEEALATAASPGSGTGTIAELLERFGLFRERAAGRDRRWAWFSEVEAELEATEKALGLKLVEMLFEAGRLRSMQRVARRLTEIDPYDERARDAIVRSFVAMGTLADAVKEIREFEKLRELAGGGTAPSSLWQHLGGATGPGPQPLQAPYDIEAAGGSPRLYLF